MERIVAFLDFSDVVKPLMACATKLAKGLAAELFLVHVSTPEAESEGRTERLQPTREGISREMREYHHELEILKLECKALGIKTTSLLVRSKSRIGNPTRKAVQEMTRLKPTMIVIGKHRHGILHGLLLGSVRRSVMRHANCPVVVVPTQVRRRSQG